MRIAIECGCIILESALKLFLAPYLVKEAECDIIISDHEVATMKPLLLVGKDIQIPFTKEKLFDVLKNIDSHASNKVLETKITELIEKFKSDLFQIIANAK